MPPFVNGEQNALRIPFRCTDSFRAQNVPIPIYALFYGSMQAMSRRRLPGGKISHTNKSMGNQTVIVFCCYSLILNYRLAFFQRISNVFQASYFIISSAFLRYGPTCCCCCINKFPLQPAQNP